MPQMSVDPDPLRLSGPRGRTYRFAFGAGPRTLAGRIVGVVVGAVTLVLAFAFSVFVFAILATVGVIAGGWLWWKTRHVRKEIREAQARVRPGEREVHGEAVVVVQDAPPVDARRTDREPRAERSGDRGGPSRPG